MLSSSVVNGSLLRKCLKHSASQTLLLELFDKGRNNLSLFSSPWELTDCATSSPGPHLYKPLSALEVPERCREGGKVRMC